MGIKLRRFCWVPMFALICAAASATEIQPLYNDASALLENCSVDGLIERVESAELPRRIKRPPLTILNAAGFAFENGNVNIAIELLRVFQHKVRSQVSPHDAALAEALIHCAGELIDGLAEAEPCSSRVLFGPTQDQIVVRVRTAFELRETPNFDQLCIYQSGEPFFWEVDMVGLDSWFLGDGSPGLAISFFSGALEQNVSLFIPNSYITNHTFFRVTSHPVSPPSGEEGVAWSFSHASTFPMACAGYVAYDRPSNNVRVNMTFAAGVRGNR